MDIRILFKNGCEFHFPNIKSYEEKGKWLEVKLGTGYKRSFSFEFIECYTIKGE